MAGMARASELFKLAMNHLYISSVPRTEFDIGTQHERGEMHVVCKSHAYHHTLVHSVEHLMYCLLILRAITYPLLATVRVIQRQSRPKVATVDTRTRTHTHRWDKV
jgi:hypothetical protein